MSAFTKTQSIGQFMNAMNLSSIELLEREKDGITTRFIPLGNDEYARVSNKLTALSGETQVSWFTPDDGEPSWMFHPKGEGGATVVSKFTLGSAVEKSI